MEFVMMVSMMLFSVVCTLILVVAISQAFGKNGNEKQLDRSSTKTGEGNQTGALKLRQ